MRYLNIYKHYDGHTANACLNFCSNSFLFQHDIQCPHAAASRRIVCPSLVWKNMTVLHSTLTSAQHHRPASLMLSGLSGSERLQSAPNILWEAFPEEWRQQMNAHGFGMSSNVEVSASIHIRGFFFFLNGGGEGLQEVLRGRMETLSCNLRQN